MRKDYEMSKEQLENLMEACRPVPYISVGSGNFPRSPGERANAAWESLGKEMGFKFMTVETTGKGDRFFSAEPS